LRWVESLPEMPVVEFRDVYVDGKKQDRFRAVVNARTGYIYDIVSDRYEFVPHEKVIEFTRKIIEDTGLEILDEEIIFGGKEKARLFYAAILKDTVVYGDPLRFGVMVTNSYDRSIGFSASGYGFRLECMNAMVFGREILKLWAPHTKALVVNDFKKLEDMIKTVIKGLSELKDLISAAMRDAISATELAEFIESLGVSKKLKEKIVRKVKLYTGFDFGEKLDAAMAEKAMINRWKAYNALTDALTHDTKHMDALTVYNLQKKASTLLVTEVER